MITRSLSPCCNFHSQKAQGRPEPIDLNDVEFIGAQEQLDLCRYFERTIPAYCDVFEFDTTIQVKVAMHLKFDI